MVGTEATAGRSSRAEVAVLGSADRVILIVQRRPCEDWFVVVTHRALGRGGPRLDRGRYQDVSRRSPAECPALVGKVRAASW